MKDFLKLFKTIMDFKGLSFIVTEQPFNKKLRPVFYFATVRVAQAATKKETYNVRYPQQNLSLNIDFLIPDFFPEFLKINVFIFCLPFLNGSSKALRMGLISTASIRPRMGQNTSHNIRFRMGPNPDVIRVCFGFHRNSKIIRQFSLMMKRKGFRTKSLTDRKRRYDSDYVSDHNTSLYGQEMKECMNERMDI